MLLSLGRGLSSMASAFPFKWFLSSSYQADGVSPSFFADYKNNRYAANSQARSFTDLLTLTRASTGTYFDASGVMQTAAIDTPRFDHDPVTHEAKGLKIEGQRTNLVLNSATGTNQSITTAATTYTLSFYGTGTVTLSGTYSGSRIGTGAYPARSTLTFTATAGTLNISVSGTVQYIQIEAGAFPSSYIPTTGSAATRATEYITNSSSNTVPFADWYNQSEGTMIGIYSQPFAPDASFRVFDLYGSANESIFGIRNSGACAVFRKTGGVTEFNPQSTKSFVADEVLKHGIAFAENNFNVLVNGGSITADTSAPMPVGINLISIGSIYGGASPLYGHIKELRYYPFRVSNSELQRITT